MSEVERATTSELDSADPFSDLDEELALLLVERMTLLRAWSQTLNRAKTHHVDYQDKNRVRRSTRKRLRERLRRNGTEIVAWLVTHHLDALEELNNLLGGDLLPPYKGSDL